ncbi:MAG TPA: DUF951 domain-containing protein [Eubacteriaceae bacterium]|nr:DUF951 domain-containing protein [Eubacteriaceae bacterium]
MEYEKGDRIQTKKPHPCGSDEWRIIRMGMDIKIKCLNCGRIVMIPREKFDKSVKNKLDE